MISTATITAAPAPSCRRTRNAQFGSILSKWKAMDRQSQRNMYGDPSCLVAMAGCTHGRNNNNNNNNNNNKQGQQRGFSGSPSKRFGGSPSQRFGPNPSQRLCSNQSQRFRGNNKLSYVRGNDQNNNKPPSVRIFQSKRFSKQVTTSSDNNSSSDSKEVIKSSDSVRSMASTVDLSDSCTSSAEDPCELIDTKESQAFVLSGDVVDTFDEHYSIGKQVCCFCNAQANRVRMFLNLYAFIRTHASSIYHCVS
jgi:hypothetical protein